MQIRTGTVSGTKGDPGWNLATGVGQRSFRWVCQFQPPFPNNTVPTIMLTITHLDVPQGSNLFVSLEPPGFDDPNGAWVGFSVVLGTQDTTQIYSCRVQWLAILPWPGA